MAEVEVTVLLEHYPGDEAWTSSVPLIENCIAEGVTPQEATAAIVPEVQYCIAKQPELVEVLKKEPEFRLSQVQIPLDENPK